MDVQEEDKLNVKDECLSESNLFTNEGDNDELKNNNKLENEKIYITATPLNKTPGHTGFLTFATKL